MIDSGASLNFLNKATAARWKIDTQPCSPIHVSVVDGRPLAIVKRQATLELKAAGIVHKETFYIAPIGIHSMILGMPWLSHFNPDINWRTKAVGRRLQQHAELLTNPLPQQTLETTSTPNQPPIQIRLTTRIHPTDQVYLFHFQPSTCELNAAEATSGHETPKILEIPNEY